MRILSIDFGEAKVGLAITEGLLAEPLGVFRYRLLENLLLKIARICEEQEIEKIVIGLSEGKMAEKQKKFAQKLAQKIALPIEFQDETLTTQEAILKMRRKGRKAEEDAVAAALILEDYLERTNQGV